MDNRVHVEIEIRPYVRGATISTHASTSVNRKKNVIARTYDSSILTEIPLTFIKAQGLTWGCTDSNSVDQKIKTQRWRALRAIIAGDLFGGLNDGLLSRAEALAAVDMGKHQTGSGPGLPQLKHDVMYHHGMGNPHPGGPNTRPHQPIGQPERCDSRHGMKECVRIGPNVPRNRNRGLRRTGAGERARGRLDARRDLT
ncbi:unnamed protein product [Bemisia tabaci]|uniref:Uncharacterized protein n=1 Tax=Bemisia tabaci TaxID=7038 RepID=A0A9P0EX62_BEMTA|nr:unnamed protein product [Bemisia tabaci]